MARRQPKYNRPTWHDQLGATLVIGDEAKLNVPYDPGPLPAGATLEAQKLYITQAMQLCRKVMNDKTQPAAERAIALCWIAHLVADSHQPCHAGSIYVENLFSHGDRGANSIKTEKCQVGGVPTTLDYLNAHRVTVKQLNTYEIGCLVVVWPRMATSRQPIAEWRSKAQE